MKNRKYKCKQTEDEIVETFSDPWIIKYLAGKIRSQNQQRILLLEQKNKYLSKVCKSYLATSPEYLFCLKSWELLHDQILLELEKNLLRHSRLLLKMKRRWAVPANCLTQKDIDQARITEIKEIFSGKLVKRGHHLVGLCPFHQENKPSFTIYPETNTYYCFGCHQHGDVINFAMKQNSLSFPQAVRFLISK